MSALKAIREELVAAIKELDLTTYTHVPGRMMLPGAFVMAGSPYIEASDTFGERLVRYGVVVAAQTADNRSETEATDALIERVVTALEADEWLVEEVSQPFTQQFNNAQALVVEITVTTTIPAFTAGPDN